MATPTSRDHKDGSFTPNVETNALLGRQAWTAALWPSPQTHDAAGAKSPEKVAEMRAAAPKRTSGGPPGFANLNELALLADSGQTLNGSTAGTANTGQLNPAHSRWLHGVTGRVGRAYGNAIVAPAATEVIRAYLDLERR